MLSSVNSPLAWRLHEQGSMPDSPESKQASLSDLVQDALQQAKTLVEAEFSLARGELKAELKQKFGAALLLAAGAMFLQAALVTLGVLLVLALGVNLASACVVLGFVAGAALLLLFGVRSARALDLSRTTARLKADARQVLETVK